MQGLMDLTDREFSILLLLCVQGLDYEEIADKLELKPSTIKTHVNKIFQKTGVSSHSKLIWSFYNDRN